MKMIIAALIFSAAVAKAAGHPVLEAALPRLSHHAKVSTSFYMDSESLEGHAEVKVVEERLRTIPGGCQLHDCNPGDVYSYRTIFTQTVKIEGLEVVGDKVMYHGAEGAIDCGTFGRSRILRRRTLFLSGNCSLEGQILRKGQGHAVLVTLETK
jgi:hypothetical protein